MLPQKLTVAVLVEILDTVVSLFPPESWKVEQPPRITKLNDIKNILFILLNTILFLRHPFRILPEEDMVFYTVIFFFYRNSRLILYFYAGPTVAYPACAAV